LLALALVAEAKQRLTLEPVCLSELVTQALLRWMPQADHRGVDLGGQGLDTSCWVMGQRALLEGLLDNLIDNALRHGRPDSGRGAQVTVVLSPSAHGPGKGALRLSVQDNGPGVPQARREQMQSRWKRGTDATVGGGHGLGLSIVSAYARHMGAGVSLADAEGGGLSVSVDLRACPPPPAPAMAGSA
jgi:two-component system sensor histidine kinase TctE